MFVIIWALLNKVWCGFWAGSLRLWGQQHWGEGKVGAKGTGGSSKVWSLVTCWDLQEVTRASFQSMELQGVSTDHPMGVHSRSSLRVSTLAQLQDYLHAQNSFPSALQGIFCGRTLWRRGEREKIMDDCKNFSRHPTKPYAISVPPCSVPVVDSYLRGGCGSGYQVKGLLSLSLFSHISGHPEKDVMANQDWPSTKVEGWSFNQENWWGCYELALWAACMLGLTDEKNGDLRVWCHSR